MMWGGVGRECPPGVVVWWVFLVGDGVFLVVGTSQWCPSRVDYLVEVAMGVLQGEVSL